MFAGRFVYFKRFIRANYLFTHRHHISWIVYRTRYLPYIWCSTHSIYYSLLHNNTARWWWSICHTFRCISVNEVTAHTIEYIYLPRSIEQFAMKFPSTKCHRNFHFSSLVRLSLVNFSIFFFILIRPSSAAVHTRKSSEKRSDEIKNSNAFFPSHFTRSHGKMKNGLLHARATTTS